uniref:Uncharacterized protein n=1 Tax=Ciona intestinalis TaxID=7719 RepID=F6U743_CIOIN
MDRLYKPYIVETSWRKRSIVPEIDSSDDFPEEEVVSMKNKPSSRNISTSSNSAEQEPRKSFSAQRKKKSTRSPEPNTDVVFLSPITLKNKISVFKEEVVDLDFRAEAATEITRLPNDFRKPDAQVPFSIKLPNEDENEEVPKVSKSSIIKAGWTVKRALDVLSPPSTCNSFYLETVAKGDILEVKVLFDLLYARYESLQDFERDVVDQNERSALRIAVENKDTNMCELLLKNKVDLGDCLFHAIRIGFLPVVETILEYKPCEDACISELNPYFSPGTTPMVLAACSNDYEIMKLLFKCGHKALESSPMEGQYYMKMSSVKLNHQIFQGMSSPAYITLICE